MNTDQMHEPDIDVLHGLQSEDSDVIRQAAFAAGDAGLVDAVDMLCQQIQSHNIGVQEAVEYALRKIRGPRTVAHMLPLLRSDDAPIRNISMDVLREIGADDLPALQALLRDSDPDIRIFIADILGCTGDRRAVPMLNEALLKDPEVNVRYQAAMSLGNLAFPEAVDALSQAMHDEEWVQFSVVESLTKIRADATISALVQSLRTCSDLVASIIIDALGEIGNIKAVPLLFKYLEKTSTPLRRKTVKALVQILGSRSLALLSVKDQESFRAYLMDALDDEEDDIRKAALLGLGVMGDASATKAILDRVSVLDPEKQLDMINTAINTLTSIGYNDAFADALREGKYLIKHIAVEACAMMEDARCNALLRNIFWNQERDIQRQIAAQLAKAGDGTEIPFFIEVLDRHTDSDVIKNALYFLGTRMRCEQAQDAIFDMLSHKHNDVKEMALEACVAIHTSQLNARFKELFTSDSPTERMMALYALSHYSPTENLPKILEALEDESAQVRQLAVECFTMPEMPMAANMSALLPRLYDESKKVRLAVVQILGQLGNAVAIDSLITALADQDEWVRIRAVEALGTLKSEAAAPRLVQLMESASPLLTFKIIQVLGTIGGNVAFRALLSMMDNENLEIQHEAAEALSKLKADQEFK